MKILIINSTETLSDILGSLTSELYVTTVGAYFFCLSLSRKDSRYKLLSIHLSRDKLARFLLIHLMYLWSFFKTAKKVDVIVLSQTADYPLLVMLLGKLMGKRIIDFVGGFRIFLSQVVLKSKTTKLRKIASMYGIIGLKISSRIVDRVVLISSRLTNTNPFNKLGGKVCIALNFPSKKFYEEFKIRKKYNERGMVVGYVGKFTLAKGVYNFALAMRNISVRLPKVRAIFVGDYRNSEPPSLGVKIIEMFKGYDNIMFVGEVSHVEVAGYLNEMKLLVLPSYSEGLPHVILEAMACGTPVLATPVGAIPDVIKDGVNGFLLESNDPQHIAERIIELLDKPDLLEEVSVNAYNYVRENFSFEKTLDAWRMILSEL
jgi:glycosyltransferase involved in cell wall biosynthesis